LLFHELLLWLFIAIICKVSGSKGTPLELWLAAATGAAPIVILAHAAKACAKLAAWGGYLPLALSDPQGVKTLARISEKTLALPSAFSGLPPIGWLMVFAMTVMVWHSRRWISQAAVEAKRAMYCSMGVCALVYGFILFSWAWFK